MKKKEEKKEQERKKRRRKKKEEKRTLQLASLSPKRLVASVCPKTLQPMLAPVQLRAHANTARAQELMLSARGRKLIKYDEVNTRERNKEKE